MQIEKVGAAIQIAIRSEFAWIWDFSLGIASHYDWYALSGLLDDSERSE